MMNKQMGTCEMDIVEFIEEYLGIKLLPYQKQILKWINDNNGGKIYLTKPHPNVWLASIYEISRLLLEEMSKSKH